MYLLLIAVTLTVLKYMEIGPVANLGWMWILGVYGLTAAWWAWADSSGYTKRDAQKKMDQKKADRLKRQREELGLGPEKRKR